ncbi:hypothetical protein C9419_22515 [Paraburkholderia fungorum]|nr:MAG: hypothetical protein DI523_29345 [Paraburkholderia fungorum]QLD51776.1 hypothetical protein C9419_22515 [Paraburkholderia fungorum]
MCLAVHANAASAGQGGRDEQRRQQDEQIATTFGKRSGDKWEFFVLRFTSKKAGDDQFARGYLHKGMFGATS